MRQRHPSIMFVFCCRAALLRTQCVPVATLLQYPAVNSYHQQHLHHQQHQHHQQRHHPSQHHHHQQHQHHQQQQQQQLYRMSFSTVVMVGSTTRCRWSQVRGWWRGKCRRPAELLDKDLRLSALGPKIVDTQTLTPAVSLHSLLNVTDQCEYIDT